MEKKKRVEEDERRGLGRGSKLTIDLSTFSPNITKDGDCASMHRPVSPDSSSASGFSGSRLAQGKLPLNHQAKT